jgi:hypothetical protein
VALCVREERGVAQGRPLGESKCIASDSGVALADEFLTDFGILSWFVG